MPAVLLSITFAIVLSIGLFVLYRRLAQASPVLGYIVAAGIILRAFGGVLLFAISFFRLPLLANLHTGDGFWRLAPDAKGYYDSATYAVEHGLGSLPPATASAAFVQALALWMRAVGTSPASGFFFNLFCYMAVCGLLVREFQPLSRRWNYLAASYALAAFTFSPLLLLYGTQPLKDSFISLLLVALVIIARRLATVCTRASFRWSTLLPSWMLLVLVVFLFSGVRVYYPFVYWTCLVVLFAGCALQMHLRRLQRVAAVGAMTMTLVWIAFVVGGGSDAYPYVAMLRVNKPTTALMSLLHQERVGFAKSGGTTNLATAVERNVSEPKLSVPSEVDSGAIAKGLASLVVPMFVLKALSIVSVQPALPMLLVADLDTLFFDTTAIVAIAALAMRSHRDLGRNIGYIAFAGCLTLLTAVLLAYVVTNVGTLLRLRLMVAFSVWTLPVALGSEADVEDRFPSSEDDLQAV